MARSHTPKRLNDKAVKKIATPGITTTHQAVVIYGLPLDSMVPQEESGGCMPNPRKLRVASVNMIRGTSRAATVISGVIRFGSTWRISIRPSFAPMALAASTKGCSRNANTTPLVTRAYSIHRPIAKTRIIFQKPVPKMNSTIRARRFCS